MSELKRYHLEYSHQLRGIPVLQKDDGEWVKYEDAKKELEAREREIEDLNVIAHQRTATPSENERWQVQRKITVLEKECASLREELSTILNAEGKLRGGKIEELQAELEKGKDYNRRLLDENYDYERELSAALALIEYAATCHNTPMIERLRERARTLLDDNAPLLELARLERELLSYAWHKPSCDYTSKCDCGYEQKREAHDKARGRESGKHAKWCRANEGANFQCQCGREAQA